MNLKANYTAANTWLLSILRVTFSSGHSDYYLVLLVVKAEYLD